MGDRLYLGRSLHRFVHELLREVAGGDFAAATSLLESLYHCGALEYVTPGYRTLDRDAARETIHRWLPRDIQDALPHKEFAAARDHWPVLAAWESADVPLPLDAEQAMRVRWFSRLVRAGIVCAGTTGYRLTARGRLLLWLHVAVDHIPAPTYSSLWLLRSGCKRLRAAGRWSDSTRIAETVLDLFPSVAECHPEFAITVALGAGQMGRYDRVREIVSSLRGNGQWLPCVPRKWRIRLTVLEANALVELGDPEAAKVLCRQARIMSRGTPERLWSALLTAWIAVRAGRADSARRLVVLIREGMPQRPAWLESVLCSWLGNAAFGSERFRAAQALFADAEAAAHRAGWRERVFTMMGNSAMTFVDTGDYDRARHILTALRTRYERRASLFGLAKTIADTSRLASKHRDRQATVWASRQTIALGERGRNWLQVGSALSGLANATRCEMRWDAAEHYYAQMRELAARMGWRSLVGTADWQRARTAHYRGDTPRALRLLESSRSIFSDLKQYSRVGDVHRSAAEFLMESGRYEVADREIEAAAKAYGRMGRVRELAWIQALRIEAKLRREPDSLTEDDLDLILIEEPMTSDYSFFAHAITAVGFAVLGDWRTTRHFAKESCRQAQVLGDIFLQRRIVALTRDLETESAAVGRLGQYWEEALNLPIAGKDVQMTPRKGTKQQTVGGDRWLSARQFSEIAGVVATISDPESLTERILRFVKEQLNADRVALFLGEQEESVDLAGALGADGKEIDDIESFSRGVLKNAMEKDDVTRIDDAQSDPSLSRRASVKRLNVRSVLAAPLIRQGRVLGLLYADTLTVPGAFVEGDHEILKGLSRLLAASIEQAQRFRALEHRSAAPRRPGSGRITLPGVVADSRRMQRILRMAIKIARTEKTVILTGEPGTGKEVIADLIQQFSHRAKLPYLKLNCAAVPEANLESELFGVAAGAFTGVVAREGMFELANGGTLFLDEIGEMSMAAQSKLLRVLEECFLRRVGGKRVIAVDVRIIAATNCNLEKAVEEGRFRQDLYDRLNQFAIAIPPLREHREDIPGLAVHFLERERERENITDEIELSPEIIDWLCQSPLPGNARELANMVGKMLALDMDGILSWDDLPPDLKAIRQLQSPKFDEESSFDNMMAMAEATILKRALDNANGRIRKAARDLSMPEATLRRRLKMLDLHLPTMVQMRRKPVRRKVRK